MPSSSSQSDKAKTATANLESQDFRGASRLGSKNALHNIVDHAPTDREFLQDLCKEMATVADLKSVSICESIDFPTTRVAVLACHSPSPLAYQSIIEIENRPCAMIFQEPFEMVGIQDLVYRKYPNDDGLAEISARCFFGYPLKSREGKILGFVSLLDDRPRTDDINSERLRQLLDRAELELERRYFAKSRNTFLECVEQVSRKAMQSDIIAKMAFELNQPLTVIENHAYLAKLSCLDLNSDLDAIRQSLENISDEVERAGSELRNIKDLANRSDNYGQNLNFVDILGDLISLVEVECRKNDIQLDVRIEKSLPTAFVNGNQLQHVLMNLIRNSIDELKLAEPPENLRSESGKLKGKCIAIGCRCQQNNWIITVNDSGQGVCGRRGDDLFLPFETTKSNSLGIGLYVAKMIVESHGGTIEEVAGPLSGLCIQIRIPLGNSGESINRVD